MRTKNGNREPTTASYVLRALFREVERQGMTQDRLAGLIGRHQPAITAYRHGRHEPGITTVEAMAEVLGLEITVRRKP